MMYLARIAPPDGALDGDTTKLDSTKTGWLRVIFHDNIRWARPAYPMGRYTPPSPAWLAKYAEKLGVWVAPEWGPYEDERECHLVWFSFEPYGAKVLPPDVESGFPAKQLFFTANSEIVVDDAAGTVDVRWVDNDAADGAPNEYPARLKFDKTSKKLSLALDVPASPEKFTLEISGIDMDTIAKVGDAAVKAAIADHLQTLYTQLKTIFDAHTHPHPMGPTSPPPSPAPPWDAKIASTHLLLPTQN